MARKGTRALQQLPASADAFVWLRLYQVEMDSVLPRGSRQPLWWTLRQPFRPLGYHAVHRMFERAGAIAGTDATLHSLRHTAAYRMAADPALPLTGAVRPGHALLTTTQLYLTQLSGIASAGRETAGRVVSAGRIETSARHSRSLVTRDYATLIPSDARNNHQEGKINDGPPRR